jgi:hypothetical protein
MESLGTLWRRLQGLIRGSDRDLDDELAFHLAMREAKNHAADVPADEAQAAAKRQFGNVARIKEACREMHTLTFLETFWQDVRYGARGLKLNPILALIVIVTLALGIGVSSWNYAILHQWVIEAVSFPHPDRLVVLWEMDTKNGSISTIPAPDYLDWKRQNQVMETLSAWSSREFSVTGGAVPQRISGGRVSADFFRTLGARPFLGRDFLESDDQQGAAQVAIVSYGFWRERLGGDPNLAGATVKLDGESYAVVGVMPDDFHFTLMGRANIWVPLAFPEAERADRSVGSLQVVGRLKPGVTLASAREAVKVIASNLEKAYPETNTNAGIQLLALSQEIGRHVGNEGMYTGFVVGICILLIACSNVAGLYLARGPAKRNDDALGARRAPRPPGSAASLGKHSPVAGRHWPRSGACRRRRELGNGHDSLRESRVSAELRPYPCGFLHNDLRALDFGLERSALLAGADPRRLQAQFDRSLERDWQWSGQSRAEVPQDLGGRGGSSGAHDACADGIDGPISNRIVVEGPGVSRRSCANCAFELAGHVL